MSEHDEVAVNDTHTPGPWRPARETDYVPAQVWAEGRQLAEVYGPTRYERAANARLMAAAPDLLSAARTVLADLNARIDDALANGGTSVPVFHGIAALHAAVAKAEGRSS